MFHLGMMCSDSSWLQEPHTSKQRTMHMQICGALLWTWSMRRLAQALAEAVVGVGCPAAAVQELADLVKASAAQHLSHCITLALAAERTQPALCTAVTDALLASTLLADNSAQIINGLDTNVVRSLAVFLCRPSNFQYFGRFASTVLKHSNVQQVLQVLLRDSTIKGAAQHIAQPLASLASARLAHVRSVIP